jgi:hypothetical protein
LTLAQKAIRAFADAYGAKFGKAAAKITDDAEQLLAFYDYPGPAAHPFRPSPTCMMDSLKGSS